MSRQAQGNIRIIHTVKIISPKFKTQGMKSQVTESQHMVNSNCKQVKNSWHSGHISIVTIRLTTTEGCNPQNNLHSMDSKEASSIKIPIIL